jgi:integrase
MIGAGAEAQKWLGDPPSMQSAMAQAVTPVRRANAELRPREHLTEREVEKLIEATKGNRWGRRDSTMILLAFRHGLRASELCGLQWSDVEFESGTLHLRRAKGGATATHPLLGDELRALRALKREAKSPFIFVSERGAPFSVAGLTGRACRHRGQAALQGPSAYVRHATGFALANKGTDTRTLQAWPSQHSIDSALHRAGTRQVQEPVAVKPNVRVAVGGRAKTFALGIM